MSFNQRYSEPSYYYGTQPNDFVVEVAPQLPRGKLLCLGEGEGRNAVYLAGLGFEVVALDASAVGLQKARALAVRNGVEIETLVADLEDFRFSDAEYEAIFSIWCHLPLPLRARVHQGAKRALKPGGSFVLEAYSPAQLGFQTGGPREADWLVEIAELKRDFADFTLPTARASEREVIEGKFHNGLSAVTQFWGIKP